MQKLKLLTWLYGILLALPMALAEDEMILPTDQTTFAKEIYYGILLFFSGTLRPLIVFVFLIFSVLIILLIGFLIKKIMNRIAEMGG